MGLVLAFGRTILIAITAAATATTATTAALAPAVAVKLIAIDGAIGRAIALGAIGRGQGLLRFIR